LFFAFKFKKSESKAPFLAKGKDSLRFKLIWITKQVRFLLF